MHTIQEQYKLRLEAAENSELLARENRSAAFWMHDYVRRLPNIAISETITSAASAKRVAAELTILSYLKSLKTGAAKQSGIRSRAFTIWTFEELPPPEDIRNYLYRMRDKNLVWQCPLGHWSLTTKGAGMFLETS